MSYLDEQAVFNEMKIARTTEFLTVHEEMGTLKGAAKAGLEASLFGLQQRELRLAEAATRRQDGINMRNVIIPGNPNK